MAHPVRWGGDFDPGHFPRHIGDERQGRRVIGNRLCHLPEVVQHGLHQWRVEGMGDGQSLCLDPLGGELFSNF